MTEQQEEEFIAPYSASAMRHKLAFGCDRILSSLLVTSSLLIAYLWMTPWAYVVSAVLIFGGVKILRKMGKHDPLLVRVFIRSLLYRKRYAATRKRVGQIQACGLRWRRAGAF